MSNNQYAIASLSQSPTLSTLQGIVIQTISICTNKEINIIIPYLDLMQTGK